MRHLNLASTIALIAFSGCSAPAPEGHGIEPPLSWAVLPDGSKMAVGPLLPEGAAGSQPVVRCWPQEPGFECLAINGEKFRDIRRFRTSELPARLWDETSPAGYECEVTDYLGIGYKETIHGTAGQLKEHLSSDGFGNIEGSWSKKYVEDYWRANGIKPETMWMNCLALARILGPNSNATVGTTYVSLSLLDKGS